MTTSSALELERLLSHDEWTRRLARRLVADPNLADDLVQEAWLAALEEPAAARDRRSWLGGVVRNLRLHFLRGEGRRKQRERAVARREELPSTG